MMVIGALAKAVFWLAPTLLTFSETLNDAHRIVPLGMAVLPARTVNFAWMNSPGLKLGRSQL